MLITSRPHARRFPTAFAIALLLGAVTACYSPAAYADSTVYRIAVDLTGVGAATLANPSYAEVQFNPASPDSLAASVALSNFVGTGGATLGSSFEREGGATGSFAAGTVANSGALNRLNQDVAVTLASTFRFDVTFSGAALSGGATDGSTFAFALFLNRTNRTPYPNTAPDAQSLVTIDLNPDGTLTPTTYNAGGSGAPVVTISAVAPAVVPETNTLSLVSVGLLAGVGGVIRRRRAATIAVG